MLQCLSQVVQLHFIAVCKETTFTRGSRKIAGLEGTDAINCHSIR